VTPMILMCFSMSQALLVHWHTVTRSKSSIGTSSLRICY